MESKPVLVKNLKIDLRNPRIPDEEFKDEKAAIEYLVDNADVNELVQSIGRSGWLDFEPLIALTADNTVIEGNRRLAAVRLLEDEGLRRDLGYRLPAGLQHGPPEEVRVFYVNSRAEARDYIGFKHINGAYKWDSFAKAKYAAEWLDDEPKSSIKEISQRLGDGHSTVLRLVNAYRVLRQSEKLGFNIQDITARRGFSFSHLYTALPSPAVREFLGLTSDASETLPSDPIPSSHKDHLLEYLTWLYGQKGSGDSVIGSQNPDLGRLTKVLTSSHATQSLRSTRSLDEAYDLVEDKAELFANAAYALLKSARDASQQIGNFDGDPDILRVVETAFQTVRRLYRGLQDQQAGLDEEGSDGA